MKTKAYMSALAHWRIPAILSGTLMMVLALSACTHRPAAPGEPVASSSPAQSEAATAESALHTFSNPDTVAWLTVPGTNIDGPVQQGPDNDYYLRRDSDGNEDFRGCYFADSDAIVSLANLSRNLVIYGHTFTDGWDGGFAQLDKYLDADWALEHTDIQVEIGGTVLTYEVCSVGFCNTEETSLPIYCNLDDEGIPVFHAHGQCAARSRDYRANGHQESGGGWAAAEGGVPRGQTQPVYPGRRKKRGRLRANTDSRT